MDFSTPTTNFFLHVSFLPLVCSINTDFMFSFAASTALLPITTLVWESKPIIGAWRHCCCSHYMFPLQCWCKFCCPHSVAVPIDFQHERVFLFLESFWTLWLLCLKIQLLKFDIDHLLKLWNFWYHNIINNCLEIVIFMGHTALLATVSLDLFNILIDDVLKILNYQNEW